MTSNGSLITQVAEHNLYNELIQDDYIRNNNLSSKPVKLDLRGERIDVDIETLILFPDSFTFSMFPDGLGLHPFGGATNTLFEKIHPIDLDPACFHYLHTFFEQTRQETLDTHHLSQVSMETDPLVASLLTGSKQLVIVLREELDYFILPNSSTSSQHTLARHQLKTQAGQHLVQENKVFDALIRNIEKEHNQAEHHLVAMLCEAGFSTDDPWAYRALDPKRTCITSLSLCRLSHTLDPTDRMDIIQRFMLFWKKPARKCWWDVEQIELDGTAIRLWKRRTFWLELATV